MATQSKEEIYFAVCNAILKMEVAKGHLQWTLSDISRESNVTRSLIYYYFGKEKDKVLEEAYKFVISHIFNMERTKTVGIRERLRDVLRDVKNMPYLFVLYYLEKNAGTQFGKMINEAEALLMKAMKIEFPDLSEIQILEIYLKELGAIAFQLPPERVNDLFADYIKKN
ncbi:TetR/AcrR family transcriptional regulator [Bdellovibrio bacteriovorus]|uniref:TetR/AcrR family transcriptional regulator n=1 Tax=Bdellovibrio bacteriovorus TaxID=959 RepID=UPI001E460A08|nr:TetR family transcriptional regulator [Bdellovibrio bacteriovorus]